MDKISELKEKLADEYAFQSGINYGSGDFENRKRSFISAFDAAMELQLPEKIEAAKKGWDWAMNFCNNLCVQISDEYNNNDQIEQADAAMECYKKIQANMGYYPPEITNLELQQIKNKMRHCDHCGSNWEGEVRCPECFSI